MKRTSSKKLGLYTETVRNLRAAELAQVAGGWYTQTCYNCVSYPNKCVPPTFTADQRGCQTDTETCYNCVPKTTIC